MSEAENSKDIVKLDSRVSSIEKQVDRLWNSQSELKALVQQINATLNQVKYTIIGVIFTLTAQSFGLFEALKSLVKI